MRTLLTGFCIAIASVLAAQRNCATTEYLQLQLTKEPALGSRISQIEDFIQQQTSLQNKNEEGAIRIVKIPVVVHILYNTNSQDITDEMVYSQLKVLNNDFRRLNSDTINTPLHFRNMAADVQVEFYLATADPEGRPTTGIIRKKTSSPYFSNDDRIKYSAQGGDDAWDRDSYLNIWVGNLRSLLGYSSIVGCDPEVDGVVINYSAFGTIGRSAPYHLGRTAVHEIGHWLGLKHIWGDSYCGDDSVHDTPRQGNFTPGCPTGFRSSCNNGAEGDMFMNYMDYTDDACVNLFTVGQRERMQSLFNDGGPREALLYSRGLEAPWKEPIAAGPLPVDGWGVNYYPNPVRDQLTVQFTEPGSYEGKVIEVLNANGAIVLTQRIGAKNLDLNLSDLRAGMYFIRIRGEKDLKTHKLVKL